jgi:osmotically-inducible protein OsmY
MNALHNRIILTGAVALALSLLGCERTAEYDTTSSKPGSTATDQSAAAPSTAPSESSTSAKAVVEDSVITGKVKAALLTDPDVKSTDITVDTKQGVVQLGGVAQSKVQADKAVSVARAIEGVYSVENNISVKGEWSISSKPWSLMKRKGDQPCCNYQLYFCNR